MENTSISDLYQFDSSPFTEDKECVMDKFLESHYKGIHCLVRFRVSDGKTFVELYDFYSIDGRRVIALLEFRESESFLQEVKACVRMYLLFRRESVL
jgi:hypothetical protein